ncbi:hypothetical protein IFM51744_04396 [Aspergillus udagawae]|uniref:Mitochondrial phosphate carrier protein n=1 Tax=Aspergillus udagawae TaxID=91492 RepID=A0A8H3P231_9EURO|nr:hypothetical protein IFM46972_01237 [Aspergillus udagawae]GFF40242.1 hypothetical protein IFM51744_04396 [Aspergillus udagawae]
MNHIGFSDLDLLQQNMIITRGISLVNFAVASSALAFQVFVLYPWHNQLDAEFKALKEEHIRVLNQMNRRAVSQ